MDLHDEINSHGGFATTRELRAAGATEHALTRAVRSGVIRRVRNGWYSTVAPSDPRFRAIRAGGRLTGISAFESWGAWVWNHPTVVHVAVAGNAARLRRAPGIRISYGSNPGEGTRTAVSVGEAVVHVLLNEPLENAIPCVDWALSRGRLDIIDFERAILRLPEPARAVRSWVDGRSQSVLESVARVRLRLLGYRVASQVSTGMLDANDLVIEDCAVLELDGREFHESTFEKDRRKDLITTIEGRHVIRVSEGMLRYDWPSILGALEACLRARSVGNSGDFVRQPTGSQRSHGR